LRYFNGIPSGPRIPGDPPKPPGNSSLSYKDWLKLPLKDMKLRQKDVDQSTVSEV